MLKTEKYPKAKDGYRWILSDEYPVNLSVVKHKMANVFGVLPCEVEQIFDNTAAKSVVKNESLLHPTLSKLYRSSSPDFWLAKLIWTEESELMVTRSSFPQKKTAIALVPQDLKPYLATAWRYKALLKVATKTDPAYLLVGIQIIDPEAQKLAINHL
jgi:hypothetical protein